MLRAPAAVPAAVPASKPVDGHTTGVYCRDERRTTWRTVLARNGWQVEGFVCDTDPIIPVPRW